MGATSVIELLTRYRVSDECDPKENRLTAALAAVLELDTDGTLARKLGSDWLPGLADSGRVNVWCQRPVPIDLDARGFIDLELRFDDGHVIWVEAKINSGQSGPAQLKNYERALQRLAGDLSRLIVLAPAHRRPEFNLPRAGVSDARVTFGAWQDVCSVLEQWSAGRPPDAAGWLAEETVEYMKGLGLMQKPLTKDHVEALLQLDEALDSLTRVLEDVKHAVDPRWGLSHDLATRPAERVYTELILHEEMGSGWGPHARRAWGVDLADDAWFAGVRYLLADPPPVSATWTDLPPWILWPDKTYGWRYQRLPMEEVTAKPSSVPAQAATIERFVRETFGALDRESVTGQH